MSLDRINVDSEQRQSYKCEEKMSEKVIINREVKQHIVAAGVLLKKDFPNESMQICFNLTQKHNNVNYNIKISGIECPIET